MSKLTNNVVVLLCILPLCKSEILNCKSYRCGYQVAEHHSLLWANQMQEKTRYDFFWFTSFCYHHVFILKNISTEAQKLKEIIVLLVLYYLIHLLM